MQNKQITLTENDFVRAARMVAARKATQFNKSGEKSKAQVVREFIAENATNYNISEFISEVHALGIYKQPQQVKNAVNMTIGEIHKLMEQTAIANMH